MSDNGDVIYDREVFERFGEFVSKAEKLIPKPQNGVRNYESFQIFFRDEVDTHPLLELGAITLLAKSSRKPHKGPLLAQMEGAGRRQFYTNLLDALWLSSDEEEEESRGTFAVCEVIKHSQGFILTSFHVEGAGELQLPLSVEDTIKLKSVCEQAPFGKGLATLVDTKIRRCWQVDASKVSFPGMPAFISNTVHSFAMKAVRALGLDAPGLQLEVQLYKLLLYETGGHFTFHRDTEKVKGMFATFILQLPTEEGYTGGKLVVKHQKEEKEFDCHMVSSLGFCYTAFFADCLRELTKIESGTRFCLAFNLVKRDPSLDPAHREFISNLASKAELALNPYLVAATDRNLKAFGGKLAIPLQHKYTEENLSFGALKGDDSVVAEVLEHCRDKNKERWLDLHLCLVTKFQHGEPVEKTRRRYNHYFYGMDSGHHDMAGVFEEKIEFKKWIGLDCKLASEPFKDLCIDLDKEVVVEEGHHPFEEPDDEDYESYMGNSGPTLTYWYHTAMLVVWPKKLSISIACETGVLSALDHFANVLEISDPDFCGQLHQVVCYCEKNISKVWPGNGSCTEDPITSRLISLCTRASMLEDLLQIFQMLAKEFQYKTPKRYPDNGTVKTSKVGVRNADVVEAIGTSIQVFGWESVSCGVIALVKECALDQGEFFAQLAKDCYAMGNEDAGADVANTTFGVFEARIAELKSEKMPVFTWCQRHANLPDYPEIEMFLRGPTESHVHHVLGLPNARSFAGKYFNCYETTAASYSAVGKPGGIGHGAYCEIHKTRRFFEADMKRWREGQELKQQLTLALRNLRSTVHVAISAAVTADWFSQFDSKRQRLATEGPVDTTKQAPSSGASDIINLSDGDDEKYVKLRW